MLGSRFRFICFLTVICFLSTVAAGADVSLDGPWAVRLDPGDVGREAGWHAPDHDVWSRSAPDQRAGSVDVPGALEATLGPYDGVVWFRRAFVTPSETPDDTHWFLALERANGRGDGWWNGLLPSVYPQLRPMFSETDFAEQRRKLAASLATVVALVDREDGELEATLAQLGRRHGEIGTRPEHYPMVSASLLAVLAETLDDDWTPEAAETWSAALSAVSAAMIAAQEAHAA